MQFSIQHNATRTMQKQLAKASLTRMLDGFRSPRRLVLSLVALALGLLWVGQAAAGVFLREAAEPVRLTAWLTFGMFGFATWNLLKVVYRKPVEPFEWTLAEKEWLINSPLSRKQQVGYRLSTIAKAALFKAGLFSVVMIPDLTFLLLGFVGMFIGLMLIELLRMNCEVAVWGMTEQTRRRLKLSVGVVATSAAALGMGWLISQHQQGQFRQLFSLSFINCVKDGLVSLPASALGLIAMAPFRWLAESILAASISWSVVVKLVAGFSLVVLLWRSLTEIDQRVSNARIRRAQKAWQDGDVQRQAALAEERREQSFSRRNDQTPFQRLGRVGGLIWRQWQGVIHYRSSVLVAMIVPALLALSPAFNSKSDIAMLQQIVVLISCYSVLLLPTAFKFDFRRDLDRMAVLKSLPMSPMAVAWSQVAMPIMLTSVFQFFILLVTMLVNPYHLGLLLSAMLILVPCNVFIFATENLMFLLYPYRVSEEGLRVFLRTILAFTAKGIMMAIGMGLALGTYLTSRLAGAWIVDSFGWGTVNAISLSLFSLVSGVGMTLIAWLTIRWLARAFEQMDLSVDLNSVQAQ